MNEQLTLVEAIVIAVMSLGIGGFGTFFLNRWLAKPEEPEECDTCDFDPVTKQAVCAWGDCKETPTITVNDREFCSWDHVPQVWRNFP